MEKLSINLATVRQQWTLREAVEACARHGISCVNPWRDQIASTGLDAAVKIITDNGMRVSGYCRGGPFPAADAASRQAAIDDSKRAIDEAAALGAACLVLVVGGMVTGSRDMAGARQMALDGMAALLPHARACNVPLALEPLHPMYAADRACVNTLKQALDMAGQLGDHVGVAIDTYHVWWDPELEAQIARAGREQRILAYHINDWLVPTSDMVTDRGMPGDGIIDLPLISGWIAQAGYQGDTEIELFSRAWWARPGDEVLKACVASFPATLPGSAGKSGRTG